MITRIVGMNVQHKALPSALVNEDWEARNRNTCYVSALDELMSTTACVGDEHIEKNYHLSSRSI